MKKFILLSFAILTLGFFELSGGAEFDPQATGEALLEARKERVAERRQDTPGAAEVTAARDDAEAVAGNASGATATGTSVPLNLVTFSAAAGREPQEAPEPPAPARAAPIPASEPVEAPDDMTSFAEALPQGGVLDSAAEEEEPRRTIAFAGTTISSSPQRAPDNADIRTIKGTLVNMRSGPGTDYDVVDQLAQSTRVIVLSDSGNGWVELRPVEGGTTGWIAAFLLSDG